MSDDQAREMRPETTSEHIARDMREGRFPEQSERQMVPVLASLPHEIQVWRSMDALDHTGTWSTTRYPAEAVTYVSKADAQAAVALAVSELRQFVTDSYQCGCMDAGCAGRHAERNSTLEALSETLDALSAADGLAAVEALRAEARENAMQALASMGQAQEAYEAQLEAEAELARLRDRERVLADFIAEFAAAKIDALRYQPAYGESPEDAPDPVVEAETVWAWQEDARAALAQTTTDPGDGWTWNERLGWIGPDGKPADPRRRG